jgi:antitoxin component YwqK of YwqJK toxin-antitoxin module
MNKFIIILILLLACFSVKGQENRWSIPDTIDLGVISLPDSIGADRVGSRFRVYFYIPVSYDLKDGDSLEFLKIVAHRANTVAHQPKEIFKKKGSYSVKVKTTLTVDKSRDGYLVMALQSNMGRQVCRVMYKVIGLDQMDEPTTGPFDGKGMGHNENGPVDNKTVEDINCTCSLGGMAAPLILNNPSQKYVKKKHSNGKVWEEGIMLNDKIKYGKWIKYYNTGVLQQVGVYDCGREQGLFKFYHHTGYLHLQESYLCGQRQGKSTTYHSDGKTHIVQYYVKGQRADSSLNYYKDGTLYAKQFFEAGVQHGPQYVYAPEGYLKTYHEYDKGVKAGSIKTYHKNGALSSLETYIKIKRVRDTSLIDTELMYHMKSLRHGSRMSFYENGEPYDSTMFQYGKQEGLHYRLYQNGDTAIINYYEDGKPTGQWREYHQNGQLIRNEFYVEGRLDGKAVYYNKDGSLRRIEYYKEGRKYVAPMDQDQQGSVKIPELLEDQIGFFGAVTQFELDSLMSLLKVDSSKYSKAGIKRRERLITITEADTDERQRILMKLRYWEKVKIEISAVGAVGKLNPDGKLAVYTNVINVSIKDEYALTKGEIIKLFSKFGEVITYSTYGAYHKSLSIKIGDEIYDEAFGVAQVVANDSRVISVEIMKYYQISPNEKIQKNSNNQSKEFDIAKLLQGSGSYASNLLKLMENDLENEVEVHFYTINTYKKGGVIFSENKLLKLCNNCRYKLGHPIANTSYFNNDKMTIVITREQKVWYLKITSFDDNGFKGILTKKK